MGTSIRSAKKRKYDIAFSGKSSRLRQSAVEVCQPGRVSNTGLQRANSEALLGK